MKRSKRGSGVSADGVGSDMVRALVDEQKAEPCTTWLQIHCLLISFQSQPQTLNPRVDETSTANLLASLCLLFFFFVQELCIIVLVIHLDFVKTVVRIMVMIHDRYDCY